MVKLQGVEQVSKAEYSKQKRQELKDYIENYKRENSCVRCGCEDWRVLEFHHVKPEEKKFSIFFAIHNRYSIPAVQREIEKTVVVCANCHRVIHHEWENDNKHSEVWG